MLRNQKVAKQHQGKEILNTVFNVNSIFNYMYADNIVGIVSGSRLNELINKLLFNILPEYKEFNFADYCTTYLLLDAPYSSANASAKMKAADHWIELHKNIAHNFLTFCIRYGVGYFGYLIAMSLITHILHVLTKSSESVELQDSNYFVKEELYEIVEGKITVEPTKQNKEKILKSIKNLESAGIEKLQLIIAATTPCNPLYEILAYQRHYSGWALNKLFGRESISLSTAKEFFNLDNIKKLAEDPEFKQLWEQSAHNSTSCTLDSIVKKVIITLTPIDELINTNKSSEVEPGNTSKHAPLLALDSNNLIHDIPSKELNNEEYQTVQDNQTNNGIDNFTMA